MSSADLHILGTKPSDIFVRNLNYLMNDHNISGQELANELGISRQAVSQYKSGDVIPDIDRMEEIADVFGIELTTLIAHDVEVEDYEGKPSTKDIMMAALSRLGLSGKAGLKLESNPMLGELISFLLEKAQPKFWYAIRGYLWTSMMYPKGYAVDFDMDHVDGSIRPRTDGSDDNKPTVFHTKNTELFDCLFETQIMKHLRAMRMKFQDWLLKR